MNTNADFVPTKAAVLARLSMNQAQLSRLLGITRAAVSHWPDNEPIPDLQWMRLRYKLRPEAFEDLDASGESSNSASLPKEAA